MSFFLNFRCHFVALAKVFSHFFLHHHSNRLNFARTHLFHCTTSRFCRGNSASPDQSAHRIQTIISVSVCRVRAFVGATLRRVRGIATHSHAALRTLPAARKEAQGSTRSRRQVRHLQNLLLLSYLLIALLAAMTFLPPTGVSCVLVCFSFFSRRLLFACSMFCHAPQFPPSQRRERAPPELARRPVVQGHGAVVRTDGQLHVRAGRARAESPGVCRGVSHRGGAGSHDIVVTDGLISSDELRFGSL